MLLFCHQRNPIQASAFCNIDDFGDIVEFQFSTATQEVDAIGSGLEDRRQPLPQLFYCDNFSIEAHRSVSDNRNHDVIMRG